MPRPSALGPVTWSITAGCSAVDHPRRATIGTGDVTSRLTAHARRAQLVFVVVRVYGALLSCLVARRRDALHTYYRSAVQANVYSERSLGEGYNQISGLAYAVFPTQSTFSIRTSYNYQDVFKAITHTTILVVN